MDRQKPRHVKKNGKRTAAIVLTVIAVVLVGCAVAAWVFWNSSGSLHGDMFRDRTSSTMEQLQAEQGARSTATPAPQAIEADWIDEDGNAYNYRTDLVTMLFIGVDYMADSEYWDGTTDFNGGNSDVLALAILDPKANKLTMLYIPRDTMAELMMLDPEGNYLDTVYTNISSAHSYGDGGTLSCELTVNAVSNLLYGVPIGRYAALSYDAIPVLNAALGGVQVTFDRDYTALDGGFTAGATVTLTDDQLKTFVTSRDREDLSGALERGSRQMLLLRSMFAQCKDAFRADVTFPMKLYSEMNGYITTDLDTTEITYLARQVFAAGFTGDSVVTLQGELTMGEEYAEYVPDRQWLHDFVAENLCVPAA